MPALLTQLPWTHPLLILGRCKRAEEREFYIRLAAQEKWSSRELERQLAGALFERAMLNQGRKLATMLRGAVREHYGNRNEKLAELGLQPLRFRQRSAAGDNPLPQPE